MKLTKGCYTFTSYFNGMKLIRTVWILILLLSIGGVFSFPTGHPTFYNNTDNIVSIAEVAEGKSDISIAELPGATQGQKIVKSCKSFSLIDLRLPVSNLDTGILEKKANIISILFKLKIIFPFHSFL